ncbi:hypothetical protein YPPY25_4869, partial [Yersinia pestis PY-25]
MRLATAC